MSSSWKVVIAVVVTAAIVGGGGYYYLNNRATKEKNDLQAQINDLNERLRESSAATEIETNTETSSTSIGENSIPTGANSSSLCSSSSMYSYEKLKNGYVANPVSGNVNTKLTNGEYKSGTTTITLVADFVACDSSSNNKSAIILKYNDGGTGYIYFVETLAPFKGSYAPTAWAQLGDRIIMQSLLMTNDVVTVNYLSQGPNDSAASSTQNTTAVYKVPTSGTALIKQ